MRVVWERRPTAASTATADTAALSVSAPQAGSNRGRTLHQKRGRIVAREYGCLLGTVRFWIRTQNLTVSSFLRRNLTGPRSKYSTRQAQDSAPRPWTSTDAKASPGVENIDASTAVKGPVVAMDLPMRRVSSAIGGVADRGGRCD